MCIYTHTYCDLQCDWTGLWTNSCFNLLPKKRWKPLGNSQSNCKSQYVYVNVYSHTYTPEGCPHSLERARTFDTLDIRCQPLMSLQQPHELIFTYIHMHICMYLGHSSMYAWIYIHMYFWHAWHSMSAINGSTASTRGETYIYTYAYMYICRYVCMYIYIYTYVYWVRCRPLMSPQQAHGLIPTYIHIYVCMHTYTYVYFARLTFDVGH